MVSVVTRENRLQHERLLDAMFQDRKRVFVDGLRWDVAVVDGRYEIDQFDSEDAVYVIAHGDQGQHLGSLRLLPTTRPHLLDTVFAAPLGIVAPTGPSIWEMSRMCTAPEIVDRAEALRVRRSLGIAAMEFALLLEASEITLVTHSAYVPTILTGGWHIRPLCLPTMVGTQQLEALAITVSPESLRALRRSWGFAPRPVLHAAVDVSGLAA